MCIRDREGRGGKEASKDRPIDEGKARRAGLERIYLNLFRYNTSLVGKARDAYFMHALPIETLQLELA